MINGSDYYREYDLIKARKVPSKIIMAPASGRCSG